MKADKSIVITAIIAIVILVLGFLAYSTVNSLIPNTEKTIVVNGVSEIGVDPDLVAIYFNAQSIKDTSEEASSDIAEIVASLEDSLDDLGFESDSLKTENYNVRPNYVWEGGKQEQEGFIATQTLKVELSKGRFSLVDEVIDAGVLSGASINYINYELSNEAQSDAKAEAIRLASQDAKKKAEALASGLDKKVGDVITTSIDNYNYYPWRMYDFAEGDSLSEVKAETQNINPSEEEVTASVRVTFKLK
jgi:uncharacterized protein YggE